MRSQVKLPKLGETTETVVIEEWLVGVGDKVEAGQPLLTVETDKVTAEVPAPVSGMIHALLVEPGDEVPTGGPLCVVEH
jgi:pyruvate/2-oxoglutarate dehydrogenase complex dihydrolipoamide acyltransferase (E2) component